MMRATGETLAQVKDVPLYHEVYKHLLDLAAEAVASYNAVLSDAPQNASEIEGEASDEFFEVYVRDAENNEGIELQVLFRLT